MTRAAGGRAPSREPVERRRAGVLLHPTSLPGPGDNGDLGGSAYRFVDFLAACGMTVWQTLPVGPTHEDGSPYQCLSAHAGDPRLIAREPLVAAGWLATEETERSRGELLVLAASRFHEARRDDPLAGDYEAFVQEHAHWLEDYALFEALRERHDGAPWWEWPASLRDREASALEQAHSRLAGEVDRVRFEQFVFFRQWATLKQYANGLGVRLFGDMPIFVAGDSAEVWAHREYFALDDRGRAETVAGVPPDYFSETGQRWGNPVYRWERLAADGYDWWVERMRTQLKLFDWVRIDHFRGFQAYWAVPAEAETAMEGQWVEGPGRAVFDVLERELGRMPLVAEDLGVITEEVDALRAALGLPGMKVLQFAFGSDAQNPHLPHNHTRDCIAYTGTHDNDTTVGWFDAASEEERRHVTEYLGADPAAMPWALIRAAFASVARVAIVPLQDVLELDTRHRMNQPGTTEGNWQWRFEWEWFPEGLEDRLAALVALYGRFEALGTRNEEERSNDDR